VFEPSITERILHKYHNNIRKRKAPILNKQLNNVDFTIISNNCWGGIVYEAYNLKKNSPTVGAYLFAKDYLKLVKNLEYYFSLNIQMISSYESINKKKIIENHNEDCPIGVLDDIEIVFVHYKTRELALEKWNRRIKRVNWNNLIFKFSYMNSCTEEQLEEFDSLDLPGKKIMFVNQPSHHYKCGVYYPGFENDSQIYNDTYYWDYYFDVTLFLNKGIIECK